MSIIEILITSDRVHVPYSIRTAEEIISGRYTVRELLTAFDFPDKNVHIRAAGALFQLHSQNSNLLLDHKEAILKLAKTTTYWQVKEKLCQLFSGLILGHQEVTGVYEILRTYLEAKSGIVRTCALQAMVDLLPLYPKVTDEIRARVFDKVHSGSAAERARARILTRSPFLTKRCSSE